MSVLPLSVDCEDGGTWKTVDTDKFTHKADVNTTEQEALVMSSSVNLNVNKVETGAKQGATFFNCEVVNPTINLQETKISKTSNKRTLIIAGVIFAVIGVVIIIFFTTTTSKSTTTILTGPSTVSELGESKVPMSPKYNG